MSDIHLQDLNLNLLVALNALLQHRSVTQAAAQLGVTQSAASRSLGQLRRLLADPLLIRHGAKMMPTPRAEALERPIQEALKRLELALRAGSPFEPAHTTRSFRVATSSTIDPLMLPQLLLNWPPSMSLSLSPLDPSTIIGELELSTIDLAVGPAVVRSGLVCEPLCTSLYSVAMRAHHPLAKGLSVDSYLAAAHVVVKAPHCPDLQGLDAVLQAKQAHRKVALTLPNALGAPWALVESDLLFTAPEQLINSYKSSFPLVSLPLPLNVPPWQLHSIWHARWLADPGHRWLRDRLHDVFSCAPSAPEYPSL